MKKTKLLKRITAGILAAVVIATGNVPVAPGADIGFSVVSEAASKLKAPTVFEKSATTNTITLKWTTVPGASGYYLYRYNTKKKKFALYKTYEGTTCKLTKLSKGTEYKFKLAAYVTKNGKKTAQKLSSAFSVTTLPKSTGDAQLDEAVSLGIIDYKTALNAKKTAKETDIPAMLQAVYQHGYGKKSQYLAKMNDLAISGRGASRYWFAMGVFYSYCENYYGSKITDIIKFMDEMDHKTHEQRTGFASFCTSVWGVWYGSDILPIDPALVGTVQEGSAWNLLADADILMLGKDGMDYRHDFGNWWAVEVVMKLADRTTGESVLNMDEKQKWNPAKSLTIGDAAKAALRWWHSFEEPAVKVSYKNAGTYDKTIITDKLLNKKTSLPANSCQNLPASWHGGFISKWAWVNSASNDIVREEDIKIIHDAGFNFVRFGISFSFLQAPDVKSGKINETRLKELDQVLAYCMKYDMHLSISCGQYQDFGEFDDFYEVEEKNCSGPSTKKQISDFAAIWGLLARRYAAIPNEYLSFDLFNEMNATEDEFVARCSPAIDAIRAASPDRTIIAVIHSAKMAGEPGEKIAKLGVALAYHLYEPRKFCDLWAWSDEERKSDLIKTIKWPFTHLGYTYDAKSLLDIPMFWGADVPYNGTIYEGQITLNMVRDVAKKYGVGFMVNEWGLVGTGGGVMVYDRYSDETYHAYLTDMINTFKKEGIGWCMCLGNDTFGIAQSYPYLENVKYEKIGMVYIDTGLRDFFKKINK